MIVPKHTLCIRGFAEQDSEPEIFALLSKYGVLSNLEFTRSKDNTNKKAAIANYQEESQAHYAYSALHNQKFGSNYLFVDFYDPHSRFFTQNNANLSNDTKKDVKVIQRNAEKKVFKFTEIDKDRKNEKTTLFTKKNLEKMAASSNNQLTNKETFYGNNCLPLNNLPANQKNPYLTQNYYINGTMNNQQNVYLKSQINFIHLMPSFVENGVNMNNNNLPQMSTIEQIKKSYLERPDYNSSHANTDNNLRNKNKNLQANQQNMECSMLFQQENHKKFNILSSNQEKNSFSNGNMITKVEQNSKISSFISTGNNPLLNNNMPNMFSNIPNNPQPNSNMIKQPLATTATTISLNEQQKILENPKNKLKSTSLFEKKDPLPAFLQPSGIKAAVRTAFQEILKQNTDISSEEFETISKVAFDRKKLRRLYHRLLHSFLKEAHKAHLLESRRLPPQITGQGKHQEHSCWKYHASHCEKQEEISKQNPDKIQEEIPETAENKQENPLINCIKPAGNEIICEQPCESESVKGNETITKQNHEISLEDETKVEEILKEVAISSKNEEFKEKSEIDNSFVVKTEKTEEKIEEKIEDCLKKEENPFELGGFPSEELLKNKKLKTLLNFMMNGGDINNLKESILKRKANKSGI